MKKIVITGGIGSGKSVISHILRLLGYEVYDCDANAKMLMNHSSVIHEGLTSLFGADVYDKFGNLNKAKLSDIIFNDKSALHKVNAIVHPVVKSDIQEKIDNCTDSVFFIETALPHESGLDAMCNNVWLIKAPEETRVSRVMTRNGVTSEEVKARIKNQNFAQIDNPNITEIINDDSNAVLPQIISRLSQLKIFKD